MFHRLAMMTPEPQLRGSKKKAAVPDGLPAKLFKTGADKLARHVLELIYRIWQTCSLIGLSVFSLFVDYKATFDSLIMGNVFANLLKYVRSVFSLTRQEYAEYR